MRKFTQLLGVIAVLVVALTARADTKVFVHGAEGTPQGLVITTASKITFGPDGITVATDGTNQQTFAYGNTAKLTFEANQVGVDNIAAAGDFTLAENPVGDQLLINVPADFEGAALSVVSLSGQSLLQMQAWQGQPVDVSNLGKGIYLVTIDSTTLKFIKK